MVKAAISETVEDITNRFVDITKGVQIVSHLEFMQCSTLNARG
jgi:hypothetical protein